MLISRYRVPPFIATLGVLGVAYGVTLHASDGGFPIAFLPRGLTEIGNGYLYYYNPALRAASFFHPPAGTLDTQIRDLVRIFPNALILMIVVCPRALAPAEEHAVRPAHLRHRGQPRRVRPGRHRRAAAPPRRVRPSRRSSPRLAGVVNVFQAGSGNFVPMGSNLEMFAVAAVIIGGASLNGGKGRILASVVGVFIIVVMENGLTLVGLETFSRYIAMGIILIAAIVIDQLFPDLSLTRGGMRRRLGRFLARRWALLFLAVELVVFSVVGRGFFSLNGIQIVLFYGTSLFLLATAETFVIVTGGIDLSVGFVMGFATIVSAKLVAAFARGGIAPALPSSRHPHHPADGPHPGLLNGILVARLKVPPFLATFAVGGIVYGTSALLIGGVAAKDVPLLANEIGNGYLLYWAQGRGLSFYPARGRARHAGRGDRADHGGGHRGFRASAAFSSSGPGSAGTPTPSAGTSTPRCGRASTPRGTSSPSTHLVVLRHPVRDHLHAGVRDRQGGRGGLLPARRHRGGRHRRREPLRRHRRRGRTILGVSSSPCWRRGCGWRGCRPSTSSSPWG